MEGQRGGATHQNTRQTHTPTAHTRSREVVVAIGRVRVGIDVWTHVLPVQVYRLDKAMRVPQQVRIEGEERLQRQLVDVPTTPKKQNCELRMKKETNNNNDKGTYRMPAYDGRRGDATTPCG